jgi:hypothetical protein
MTYNDPRTQKEFLLRIYIFFTKFMLWLRATELFDEINLLKLVILEAGQSAEQQTTRAELYF